MSGDPLAASQDVRGAGVPRSQDGRRVPPHRDRTAPDRCQRSSTVLLYCHAHLSRKGWYIGVFPKWNRNSVNAGNLIKRRSMN